MYFPRPFLCLQSTDSSCLDGPKFYHWWESFCPINFTYNSQQDYFFTLENLLSFSTSLGILGWSKGFPWSHLASISCFHCCVISLVSSLLCRPRYETQPLILDSMILLSRGSRGWELLQKSTCLIHLWFQKSFHSFMLKMPQYLRALTACRRLGRGSLCLSTQASPHSVL